MRFRIVAILCAATLAGVANAATVFSESFDGENSGFGQLYYNNFASFDVTAGNVDLIRNGDYTINCVGGAGSCVDLNGGQAGAITSKASFAVKAGDLVTLTAQFSGNQRVRDSADFFLRLIDENGAIAGFGGGSVASDAGYATYTAAFTALAAGRVYAQLGSTTPGVYGPIVDNVSLDISARAVPEPAGWAMMITGFGGIGAGLRRRRAVAATA